MLADNERLTELVGAATDSAGASQIQFEKTLDSLEAKLNQLSNAYNEFVLNITNSGAIKGLVDITTWLIGQINNIVSALSGNMGQFGKAINSIALLLVATFGGKALLSQIFSSWGPQIINFGKRFGESLGTNFRNAFLPQANRAFKEFRNAYSDLLKENNNRLSLVDAGIIGAQGGTTRRGQLQQLEQLDTLLQTNRGYAEQLTQQVNNALGQITRVGEITDTQLNQIGSNFAQNLSTSGAETAFRTLRNALNEVGIEGKALEPVFRSLNLEMSNTAVSATRIGTALMGITTIISLIMPNFDSLGGQAETILNSVNSGLQVAGILLTALPPIFKALNVSISSGPLLGITVALSALVGLSSLISGLAAAEEELRQERIEAAQANLEEIETNRELVETYQEQLQTLRETGEGREELETTVDSLINTYGDEIDRVDLLRGRYDELTQSILEAQQAELESSQLESGLGIDAARTELENAIKESDIFAEFGDTFTISAGAVIETGTEAQIYEDIRDYMIENLGYTMGQGWTELQTGGRDRIAVFEDLLSAYQAISSRYSNADLEDVEILDIIAAANSATSEARDTYNSLREGALDIARQQAEIAAELSGLTQDDINSFEDYQNYLNNFETQFRNSLTGQGFNSQEIEDAWTSVEESDAVLSQWRAAWDLTEILENNLNLQEGQRGALVERIQTLARGTDAAILLELDTAYFETHTLDEIQRYLDSRVYEAQIAIAQSGLESLNTVIQSWIENGELLSDDDLSAWVEELSVIPGVYYETMTAAEEWNIVSTQGIQAQLNWLTQLSNSLQGISDQESALGSQGNLERLTSELETAEATQTELLEQLNAATEGTIANRIRTISNQNVGDFIRGLQVSENTTFADISPYFNAYRTSSGTVKSLTQEAFDENKDIIIESINQFYQEVASNLESGIDIEDAITSGRAGQIISLTRDEAGNYQILNQITQAASEQEQALAALNEEYTRLKSNLEQNSDRINEINQQIQNYDPTAVYISSLEAATTAANALVAQRDNLLDVSALIGDGLVVAKENVESLVNLYPDLLESATYYTDGSIRLNQEVVDSILVGYRDLIDADRDKTAQNLENRAIELDAEIASAEAELENYRANQDAIIRANLASSGLLLSNRQALTNKIISLGYTEEQANQIVAEMLVGDMATAQNLMGENWETLKNYITQDIYPEITNDAASEYQTEIDNLEGALNTMADMWNQYAEIVKNAKQGIATSGQIAAGDTSFAAGGSNQQQDSSRRTGGLIANGGPIRNQETQNEAENLWNDLFGSITDITDITQDPNYQAALEAYEAELARQEGNLAALREQRGQLGLAISRLYGGINEEDTSSTGSDTTEEIERWKNEYDWLYNLTEDINEQLRRRNRLEAEYADLVYDTAVAAEDYSKNLEDQIKAIQREADLQEEMLLKRTSEMKGTIAANSEFTRYATFNWQDMTIEIDWNALNSITDENYGEAVSEYISKLEEIQDQIDDAYDAILDTNDALQDIYDTAKDSYADLENRLLDALIAQDQRVIDNLTQVNDSINTSNSDLIEAIQNSIDRVRQARENEETERDLFEQENYLAYLRQDTSGANQLEILQRQSELDDARQSYTDQLIDQKISELQEQNDEAANQREKQITFLEAQLDWNREHGVYWENIRTMLDNITGNQATQEKIAALLKSSESWESLSALQKQEWTSNLAESLGNAQTYLAHTSGGTLQSDLTKSMNAIDAAIQNQAANIMNKITVASSSSSSTSSSSNSSKNTSSSSSSSSSSSGTGSYSNWAGSTKAVYLKRQVSLYNSSGQAVAQTNPESTKWSGYTLTGSTRNINGITYYQLSTGDWLSGKDIYNYGNFRELTPGRQANLKDAQVNTYVLSGGKMASKNGTRANTLTPTIGSAYFDPSQNSWYYTLTGNALQGGTNIGSWIKEDEFRFKQGGLADFTGPAWLDGTKSKPEIVLNQTDSQNFIQLRDILSDILTGSQSVNGTTGDNYFDITINVDELSNDYDVDQLVNRIKQKIYEDGAYRNVNTIHLIR